MKNYYKFLLILFSLIVVGGVDAEIFANGKNEGQRYKAVSVTAGKAYVVASKANTANGHLCVANQKVTIDAEATVYFTPVNGGYVISNENNEYIYKTTDNGWSLSTTTDINDAYVVTIESLQEGGYSLKGIINNLLLGIDNTVEKSSVYSDKTIIQRAMSPLWAIVLSE